MEKAADALPIDTIAKRWIVGTDPDETAAAIWQYVDWGFNHLVFHAPGADQRRFMDLFERDLAPRLRARSQQLDQGAVATEMSNL